MIENSTDLLELINHIDQLNRSVEIPDENRLRFILQSIVSNKQKINSDPKLKYSLLAHIENLHDKWPTVEKVIEISKVLIPSIIVYDDIPSSWNKLSYMINCTLHPLKAYEDFFVDHQAAWKDVFKFEITALKSFFKDEDLRLMKEYTLTNPNPFYQSVYKLISALETPQEEINEKSYDAFILTLRECLAHQSLPSDPCFKFVSNICYHRFNDIKLYPFCEKLILEIFQEGIKELNLDCPPDPLLIPLKSQFRCIQAAPQILKAPYYKKCIDKISGGLNINFDPHRYKNLPWLLYKFGLLDKTVDVIRCGTPTQQRVTIEESKKYYADTLIAPEFKQFVIQLLQEDLILTFVSHQDNKERPIGTEDTRNKAIQEMMRIFPKNFYFIILAQDTPFYHQIGIYAEMNEAQRFFDVFFEQLTSNLDGYYFPPEWLKEEQFVQNLKNLLMQTHWLFFSEKKELSLKERQQFIEIMNIRIALLVSMKTRTDRLIICCKDSIDRAGKSNAILYYLILILTGNVTLKNLKTMMINIHAAAFIVKQQAMNFRHTRLLDVIDLLQDENVMKKIQENKELFGITNFYP